MQNQEMPQNETQFLHDLSNPLAIAYGSIKLISIKLENTSDLSQEELRDKLEKAIKYFEKANQLIEKRRNYLHGLK